MLLWARNKFWYPVPSSMGETSCVGMGCWPPERLPLAYQGLVQWVTVKVKKEFTYLFIQYGTSGMSKVLEKFIFCQEWKQQSFVFLSHQALFPGFWHLIKVNSGK